MSFLNKQDKELQAAALRAGYRTFGQALEAGLGIGALGTLTLGATGNQSVFDLDYRALLGGVGFVLLAAFVAGLRSYLSISTNGLPAQYQVAAVESPTSTAIPNAIVLPVAGEQAEGDYPVEPTAEPDLAEFDYAGAEAAADRVDGPDHRA
jgi:hypothetical protein